MEKDNLVFDCIEKETLVHFNEFCKSVKNGKDPCIKVNKTECFNNGKKIADWTADKINQEYPEFTAKRKMHSPLFFCIGTVLSPLVFDDIRQYKVQVTPKCNSFF